MLPISTDMVNPNPNLRHKLSLHLKNNGDLRQTLKIKIDILSI